MAITKAGQAKVKATRDYGDRVGEVRAREREELTEQYAPVAASRIRVMKAEVSKKLTKTDAKGWLTCELCSLLYYGRRCDCRKL